MPSSGKLAAWLLCGGLRGRSSMGGCRQLSSGLEHFPPILGQDPRGYQLLFDRPHLCADFATQLRPPFGLCAGLFRQPPMRGVRRRDPRTAFRGPRPCTPPSMPRAAPRFLHSRALARRPSLSSCATAFARPLRAEPRCRADFVAFCEPHVCPNMTVII